MSSPQILVVEDEALVAKHLGMELNSMGYSVCGVASCGEEAIKIAAETHPDVVFGKVNTDEQQELAGSFGIRSIPTLVVFREKVILFQQAGALPGNALDQVIAQAKALDMAKVHSEVAGQQQK